MVSKDWDKAYNLRQLTEYLSELEVNEKFEVQIIKRLNDSVMALQPEETFYIKVKKKGDVE